MTRILLLALGVLAATSATAEGEFSGQDVFNYHCSHCHAPGRDRPGTLQLSLTRGADRGVLEERTDLTADQVQKVVRHGLKAMPPFTPSLLTDAELQALTDYLVR